jgi:hypothetical protein
MPAKTLAEMNTAATPTSEVRHRMVLRLLEKDPKSLLVPTLDYEEVLSFALVSNTAKRALPASLVARQLIQDVPARLSYVLRAAQTLRGLLEQPAADVWVLEKLDSSLAHLGVGQHLQGDGLLVRAWVFEKLGGRLTHLPISH